MTRNLCGFCGIITHIRQFLGETKLAVFLLVVLSLYHYTSNGATDEESIGPIIAVIWPRAYELQLT